jgi:2-dehydro-3-deoxyphosphooctonate aldolase (KDO 8-P synthase)
MKAKIVEIGYGNISKIKVGSNLPLAFIGGPCAIESRDHTLKMATSIKKICDEVGMGLIFKACYDKDCRSSPNSFQGVGLEAGLKILEEVRTHIGIPVTSDFSNPSWAKATGEVCDLVQIPAYLCRQTSILKAAAETKRVIHLKKGQFMSPWNMKNSIRKLEVYKSKNIILTDRGTFFGYNMLVNDMTSLPIMSKTGYPVCFDATHSIQMPTSMGNISGGQREFIPYLVRAAVACGINLLFMEVHNDPKNAKSDSNTVLDIKYLKKILIAAKELHEKRLELKNRLGELNVK